MTIVASNWHSVKANRSGGSYDCGVLAQKLSHRVLLAPYSPLLVVAVTRIAAQITVQYALRSSRCLCCPVSVFRCRRN